MGGVMQLGSSGKQILTDAETLSPGREMTVINLPLHLLRSLSRSFSLRSSLSSSGGPVTLLR